MDYAPEGVRNAWKQIEETIGFGGISITVPRYPDRYTEGERNRFQLRCWRGEYGRTNIPGHVNHSTATGELLFSIHISKSLDEKTWVEQLVEAGIDIDSRKWVLIKKDMLDIVTPR